jgi:hypothetical protein
MTAAAAEQRRDRAPHALLASPCAHAEEGRMSEHLTLTPDELLTTTRAVRRRLDFTRPVPRTVIEECLTIAQQARVMASVEYLAAHMHEAPVLVAPGFRPPDGRADSIERSRRHDRRRSRRKEPC